ncbi:MAG: trigger factor [Bacteroidales bacterium]|nr:trigger factor [Bacteroidales bacterium]
MNIKKDSIDELNVIVTIKIEKPDYEERVDNILKDYRKKARFDGFRPGKVPQGLVNKMYRKPVLAEEINKILSESLSKYLVDEKLNILGEPLPNADKPVNIDWDHDSEFEFAFDIGLAPDMDISVSEKDKLPYYTIRIEEDERLKQIDRVRSRFGTYVDATEITGNDMLKADMVETDKKGNPVENGIHVEDVTISLEFVKDEKIKKKFKGCKPGDQLIIEVKKAFENETDLAALLKIEKARLADIHPDFQVTLKTVSRFEKAEVNQDLFDKVYGKDNVKSEEEFKTKVEEELKSAFGRNSDYKFRLDAREYYLEKFKKDLPGEFLKRWLMHTNEGKVTQEQIDKDFDHFKTDLKWQLIKGKVTRDNDLKISEEELLTHAKEAIRQQFIQYYGIGEVPGDMLEKYAQESLKREEERNRYVESLNENKVYEFIQKTVKLDTKEITLEKFNKLFEK